MRRQTKASRSGQEEERRRRKKDLNISGLKMRELQELKEHEKQFRWERADKGGGIVIPRESWKEEARKYVADKTANVPAG